MAKETKDDLMDVLDDLYLKLDDAIETAYKAKVIADSLGGEIKRVVGGQLKGYTINTLEDFKDSKSQPGSVAFLLDFLENEESEEDDEEKNTEGNLKIEDNEIKKMILEGKTDDEIMDLVLSEKRDNYIEFYKKYKDEIYENLYSIVSYYYAKKEVALDIARYIRNNYKIIESNDPEGRRMDINTTKDNNGLIIVDYLDNRVILKDNNVFPKELSKQYKDWILKRADIPTMSPGRLEDWVKKEIYPHVENFGNLSRVIEKTQMSKIRDVFEDYYKNVLIPKFANDFIEKYNAKEVYFIKLSDKK